MDVNTLAKSIVDQAVGDKPIKKPRTKSPEAIARGFARAKALPAGRAKVIAQRAAQTRWAQEGKQPQGS